MADPRVDRRFLLRAAALLGLAVPAASALLDACGRPALTVSDLRLASPDHPVRWPLRSDDEPIADGLPPESGPLVLYNYADYVAPSVLKSFQKEYGVEVKVSTFNDTDEAVQKIAGGEVPYDIYVPSYDQISRLVAARLLRPLNHSYLSNIDNVWDTFKNPWYDEGWRYTVPYTVYSTGIGWREDLVTQDVAEMANPYEILWDRDYSGKTAIIDDWHTAMAMIGLRDGITDVNTSSARDLGRISDGLSQLSTDTRPKVTVSMYSDLPSGQLSVTQMWSGDVVNAQYYLPKGQSVDTLRYWFPEDGRGLVDNDLMVVLRSGRCPVLAHLFLQHMLDQDNALKNFGFIGYQPPQKVLDTDRLVADGYLPETLATAAVKESWFDAAYRLLELDVGNDQAWHQIWQQFKAGA